MNKQEIELIALRFSKEEVAKGWKTLDNLGISLHVVGTAEGLVYTFSSRHWEEVQGSLMESNISYQYQQAPGISKRLLDDPAKWYTWPPGKQI